MDKAIKISKVFGTDGAYSHVSISQDSFESITGRTAEGVACEKKEIESLAVNASGDDVRVYDFSGVKLFSCYNKAIRKSTFTMMTSDVEPILAAQKKEEAARKSGLPQLAFSTPVIA